jgi:hypothetical protein
MKEKFDYDESVKKMRAAVKQWKKATAEILRELYTARKNLTIKESLPWKDYCAEIGLYYKTADNWIKDLNTDGLFQGSKSKPAQRRGK